MDATPYPELNGVLAELVSRAEATVGDALVGLYLQGSFALGDFDEHSDVDFITVVDDEPDTARLAALTRMHEDLFTLPSEWARHLEGSYFPRDVLADHGRSSEPVWYLDHGSTQLVLSDHCNTPVVRWIVRERGVPLVGPDPAELMPPIPGDTLRKHMVSTILDWGAEIIADPDALPESLLSGLHRPQLLSHVPRPRRRPPGFEARRSDVGAGAAGPHVVRSHYPLLERAPEPCRRRHRGA